MLRHNIFVKVWRIFVIIANACISGHISIGSTPVGNTLTFFLSISLCHLLENHLCHHCFCLSGENAIQDQDVLSAALYPKVFKDYMLFKEEFGPVHGLPTRLFFTGPDIGEEFQVELQPGKVLNIKVLAISDLHPNGQREVFCEMNGQLRTVMVEDKSVTKVLTRVLTILRKTS